MKQILQKSALWTRTTTTTTTTPKTTKTTTTTENTSLENFIDEQPRARELGLVTTEDSLVTLLWAATEKPTEIEIPKITAMIQARLCLFEVGIDFFFYHVFIWNSQNYYDVSVFKVRFDSAKFNLISACMGRSEMKCCLKENSFLCFWRICGSTILLRNLLTFN